MTWGCRDGREIDEISANTLGLGEFTGIVASGTQQYVSWHRPLLEFKQALAVQVHTIDTQYADFMWRAVQHEARAVPRAGRERRRGDALPLLTRGSDAQLHEFDTASQTGFEPC